MSLYFILLVNIYTHYKTTCIFFLSSSGFGGKQPKSFYILFNSKNICLPKDGHLQV